MDTPLYNLRLGRTAPFQILLIYYSKSSYITVIAIEKMLNYVQLLTNCEVGKLKAEIVAYFNPLEYGIF
jgi:hypothetical protein